MKGILNSKRDVKGKKLELSCKFCKCLSLCLL